MVVKRRKIGMRPRKMGMWGGGGGGGASIYDDHTNKKLKIPTIFGQLYESIPFK